MKKKTWTILSLSFFFLICSLQTNAQNRNFILGVALGVGNSGFEIANQGAGELKSILYPTGGLQIQKRISEKWAINLYSNLGLSGNRRVLPAPESNITELRTTSAFVSLALHPKYYLNHGIYFSLGPEVSYLLWNYGSSFNGDERQSRVKETEFFRRTNLLLSASMGISRKVASSRKDAPVQIDALWFLELRAKKGITNILKPEVFGENINANILSFEIVTGISFASQK